MSVDLLLTSIVELLDMSRQMKDIHRPAQEVAPVSKPLVKSFEALVKLFFQLGSVDDQITFISKVKTLTNIEGKLTRNAFIAELVSHFGGLLRKVKFHPEYLKYGYTYFGKAVSKIRLKLDRPSRAT